MIPQLRNWAIVWHYVRMHKCKHVKSSCIYCQFATQHSMKILETMSIVYRWLLLTTLLFCVIAVSIFIFIKFCQYVHYLYFSFRFLLFLWLLFKIIWGMFSIIIIYFSDFWFNKVFNFFLIFLLAFVQCFVIFYCLFYLFKIFFSYCEITPVWFLWLYFLLLLVFLL